MNRIFVLLLIAFAMFHAPKAQAVFLDCVFFDGMEAPGTSNPEELAALQIHNCARKTVDPAPTVAIPNLAWSSTIASTAQTYANQCNYAHSGNQSYGENIYAAAPAAPGDSRDTALSDATSSWISEEPDYNYAANTCTPTGNNHTCGHYTQVVWRATTQVGCGAAYCTTNSPFGSNFPTWTFVVCNYSPPGNFNNQRPY